ncbi:MAG: glutamate--tRNA ligase [Pirellulales bacterium]|nr:glutamate--tRNA ligase [Pirellulales bacterium]
MTIRTRFAPSPTGYLHIGGVRTALFNWLYARQHGGQFILRIDDTDRERNIEAALTPILHGFRWLGLEWDEGPEVGGRYGPYFQSQRAEWYQAAIEALLDRGAAYRDYASPDEIQAERDVARQDGQPFVYSRRFMAKTDADVKRFEAEGRLGVIRLKMPREGKLVLDDLVRGRVEFDWAAEQDHVIGRADGSVLYNLATVVDDHAMKISHVIRAEEHLSNTPRQVFIYQSLGHDIPKFAHLPYVAEPGSKNKLSKRKLDIYRKQRDFAKLADRGQRIAERLGISMNGENFSPVIVDFYEQIGFLPEALVNYLLLLGWSLDDKTEEFTRDRMLEVFSLERINRAPASFDPQKLMAFQARAMQQLPLEQKVALMIPYLQRAGMVADPPPDAVVSYARQIIDAAGDRIEMAGDILEYADFFTPDDQLTYDEKAFAKRLHKNSEAAGLLYKFHQILIATEVCDAGSFETLLKTFVDSEGINIGQIIHALRVAITGKGVGFGMFETMAILGRDRCAARIDCALRKL